MKLFAWVWASYSESGTRFLENLDVSDSVSFGTQLHGGYSKCSFEVAGHKDTSAQRYRRFLNAHVAITDFLGRRVWEGFVRTTSLGDKGLKVDAIGYYAKASNLFFDNIYVAVEATTNLVYNPTFEVNITDGWSLINGTVERDTGDAKYGSACAKLLPPTTGDPQRYGVYIGASALTSYAVSLYLKNVSYAGAVSIMIEEIASGPTIINTTEHTLTLSTDWVRQAVEFETVANVIAFNMWVKAEAHPDAGYFRVDAVQVEQKGYVTPYCDGSLGALYSWSGTAHNSPSSRQAWSASVYDVVKDCIDMIPEWNKSYALVSRSDYWVGTRDYTDKKVKDAIEDVMKFGYDENDLRPIYFALFNDRIPTLFAEPQPTNYPDWLISSSSIVGGMAGITLSMDDVANRVYSVYDSTDAGTSKTLPSEDMLSQSRYGIIEGLVNNGNNPEGLALAEDLRDMALAKYKYPRQVYEFEITGFVQHQSGFYEYPYRIRAGQQILVIDSDYVTATASSMQGQAAHGLNGFVMATEYDAAAHSLRLTVGSLDASFEILMSRLGLSGGLG